MNRMALHGAYLIPLLPCLLFLMTNSISATSRSRKNATCDASDLAALRSLAGSFPAGDFSDWEAGEDDCCAWGPSVTCSEPRRLEASRTAVLTRRVTELVLDTQARNLNNRPIPSSVCSLSALTTLRLSSDRVSGVGLTGPVLPCIGSNLTNLVALDLSFNSLTGSIPPSLSRLHSLLSLKLSSNYLSGPLLASSLPSSRHLSYLDLSVNTLSGASFLSDLVNNGRLSFANISTLDLGGNAFSGPIPSFNMTPHLIELDLSSNLLSGSVSRLFGSLLPSVRSVSLSSNSLSGEIPSFHPSHLLSLDSLRLQDNLLNGSLPHSLCKLPNLSFLSLSSNAFSGQLLAQCKEPHFTQLVTLDLSNNQFIGDFPEWIGSLSSLEELDLSYNSFNGSLPISWRSLSSLSKLHLSGNSLVPGNHPGASTLPRWLFTFPGMSDLSLSSMGLRDTDMDCHPDMPQLFNKSREDVSLDLSGNSFTSGVLKCLSLYSSPSLAALNLSGNPLALSLNDPHAVRLLPASGSLNILDLSSCEIRGSLTHLFFDRIAPSVNYLLLTHNYLAGEVPTELGNLSSLGTLDLSHNFFTSFSPLERKLGMINDLLISNNALTGNLSTLLLNVLNVSLCKPEEDILDGFPLELLSLDLSRNFLEGLIPSFLGHCISSTIDRLKLNDNNLEGFLPSELFDIRKPSLLQVLSLSNNRFTGQIPSSFSHLSELVLLDLGHNKLQGSLESISLFSNASVHRYTYLRVLLLGYNEFTGSVPLSLGQIAPDLQLIDLSNNNLTGPIPVSTLLALRAFRVGNKLDIPGLNISVRGTLYEELRMNMKGNDEGYQYVLAALTSLDLSGNDLSGPIPTGIGELAGLVALNLSRNSLTGQIPGEIGKLGEQLQVFDVSFNELEGPMPSQSLQKLTKLAVFNVSYNKGLKGPIPQSQPQFEMQESYIGDPELCGEPILPSCASVTTNATPASHSQPNKLMHHEPHAFAAWIDEWIEIPGLCLGLVVGFFTTLFARYYIVMRY